DPWSPADASRHRRSAGSAAVHVAPGGTRSCAQRGKRGAPRRPGETGWAWRAGATGERTGRSGGLERSRALVDRSRRTTAHRQVVVRSPCFGRVRADPDPAMTNEPEDLDELDEEDGPAIDPLEIVR